MVYHRYRDCFCCIASHYKGDLIVSKGILVVELLVDALY